MPSVVIFGANGQDGYYLADLYRKRGCEVLGISRTGNWLRGDVASFDFVEEIVRSRRPDLIFHLAATSTTRHEALFENHRTIGSGTLNILESVYRWHQGCKVFLVGSGLQFTNTGEAIHESDTFDASSAYAAARIQSVYSGRYFRNLGVRVYVGYLFHHESPLRRPTHVSQKIVQAAKRIAAGSNEKLELGDISVEKEWGFAGDIAAGMDVLAGQERVFEAVIGTGKTRTIENWLQACFSSVGKDWKKHVIPQDRAAAGFTRLFSNPETMHSLGWRPKVDFTGIAELMLGA
jgi:GDPmannose 4,6-dehydratase